MDPSPFHERAEQFITSGTREFPVKETVQWTVILSAARTLPRPDRVPTI